VIRCAEDFDGDDVDAFAQKSPRDGDVLERAGAEGESPGDLLGRLLPVAAPGKQLPVVVFEDLCRVARGEGVVGERPRGCTRQTPVVSRMSVPACSADVAPAKTVATK